MQLLYEPLNWITVYLSSQSANPGWSNCHENDNGIMNLLKIIPEDWTEHGTIEGTSLWDTLLCIQSSTGFVTKHFFDERKKSWHSRTTSHNFNWAQILFLHTRLLQSLQKQIRSSYACSSWYKRNLFALHVELNLKPILIGIGLCFG